MLNVTIAGHSFVRRLRQRYAPPHFIRTDISPGDLDGASCLADKLNINLLFHRAFTTSNMNIFTDLPIHFECASDLLVVDFGSNDLANLKVRSERAATSLAEYIFLWGSKSGASCVLFLGVMPRTGRLSCSVEVFDYNRTHFNNAMHALCTQSVHCRYRKLRGFECDNYRRLKPVSSWSTDGIHPTSMYKYKRMLTFAMLQCYTTAH